MSAALRALEAELRRLDAAATPGPWATLPPDKDCPDWFIIRRPGRVSEGKFYILRMGPDDDGPDARLIAALRNALPALLDALAQQTTALATAREGALEEAARVCEETDVPRLGSPGSYERPDDGQGALNAAAAAIRALAPAAELPTHETCGDCDGCGWWEGGPTLKTRCSKCNGTGELRALAPTEGQPAGGTT